MSKLEEIKLAQGFQKKCPCCSNCKMFSFELVTEPNRYSVTGFQTYERSLKCNVGSFTVKKTNWCKNHIYAE